MGIKNLGIATLLLIFSTTAYASTGMNYYPQAELQQITSGKLKDRDLKDAIHDILTSKHKINADGSQELVRACDDANCFEHRKLSYKYARRHLFGALHLEGNQQTGYSVKGVYCQNDFKHDVGPKRIPNANVLNCEHSWPQSKFQGFHSKGMQKGDLHHLFPTDSRINSIRGNYEFGEVHFERESYCTGAKFGGNNHNPSDYYFEPPNEHKGNVARALFYFSIRYQIRISKLQEYYLKKWHQQDPVDAFEMWRNDQIEDIQGNRNPFIDLPDLVDNISDF
jgi:deoxyribonuclease-1